MLFLQRDALTGVATFNHKEGSQMVSVDELVDLVCGIAGKKLTKVHNTSKPQGVRGRNSDNSRLRRVLQWEPGTALEQGLAITYEWIRSELMKTGRIQASAAGLVAPVQIPAAAAAHAIGL